MLNMLNIIKSLVFISILLISGCSFSSSTPSTPSTSTVSSVTRSANNINIPKYNGQASIIINDNIPFIDINDAKKGNFEIYSELDSLGRCGVAYANICKELMPIEKRGNIGQIKPSGWQTVRYDDLIDGKYLYNRCHLIGYQLAGENANPKNLITGTRYLNITGMVPYENRVADYVKRTGNHVLYRVTSIFLDKELVCRGLYIEALSVEDNGKGIKFNVFCYNVQPYISIDYATGNSQRIQ